MTSIKYTQIDCTTNSDSIRTFKVISPVSQKVFDKFTKIENAKFKISGLSALSTVPLEVRDVNDELIEKLTSFSGTLVINVTSELQYAIDDGTDLIIKIHNSTISDVIQTELVIDYESLKIFREDNVWKSFSAGRAGSGKLNLHSGILNFSHSIAKTYDKYLPIDFAHIYSNSQAGESNLIFNYGSGSLNESFPSSPCGKGFKLSTDQYIYKHTQHNDERYGKFTYIDENGNYVLFEEKFYYKNNVEKVFIDKNQTEIDQDGRLWLKTDTTTEVFLENISKSGLKLVSHLEGIDGLNYIEQRTEELIEAEENLEQLEKVKSELLANKDYYTSLKNLWSAETSIQNLEKDIRTNSLWIEQENYAVAMANKERRLFNYTSNCYLQDNLEENKQKLYDLIINYKSLNGCTSSTPCGSCTLNLGCKAQYYLNTIENQGIYYQINKNESDNLTQYSYYDSEYKNYGTLAFKNTINSKTGALNTQSTAYLSQKTNIEHNRIDEEILRLSNEIEKYNKQIKKNEHKVKCLQEETPRYYIIDGEKNIFYFSGTDYNVDSKSFSQETYRLIAINDAYGNSVYFTYDQNNLISVSNKEQTLLNLTYKNNMLSETKDALGNIVKFTYENGFLIKATYAEDVYSTYKYDSSGNLEIAFENNSAGILIMKIFSWMEG